MNRISKITEGLLIVLLCLLVTGCIGTASNETFKKWQDLIRLLPEEEKGDKPGDTQLTDKNMILGESIDIDLYFIAADGKSLAAEKRTIPKTEGIARKTLEELIKGPENADYGNPLPAGIKLLDINIKADGLCIVDLSSQARQAGGPVEEQLMVYAIANTAGQFPTVSAVTFMVDGEKVNQLGGYLDLSIPLIPDYGI